MNAMLKKLFQNARDPKGAAGAFMLRKMRSGHRLLWDGGFALLSIPEGAHTLDIGCGAGDNIRRVLETVPGSLADGLDASEVSVRLSRKRNKAYLGSRCVVRQGTADSLPYLDDALDVVTAFETVYFWGELAPAFREVRRVLKPGGVFLVCVEAHEPGETVWEDIIEGMRVYTGEELQSLLEAAGFAAAEVHEKPPRSVYVLARK
jgi:ubiquinone/menaquinone biosynthesis C-methylase UbiE